MDRFPYGRTVVLGFGFLGISLVWPIFNQFIPIFLQAGNPEFTTDTGVVGFGLSPALALFIMTWDNLINVFVQPWVGERSDRTWNRFGRRKSWILLGVPFAVIGLVPIPLAQSALGIAVFILITNIGMAVFRSPTVAWLGDLFKPDQRSQANGLINLMGGVGGLLAFFAGGWLFDNVGRAAPFVFGAVMLVAATSVVLIFVREPERLETEDRGSETQGVMNNLKHVIRSPDRSGLFVLIGILLWFMAFNALEAGLSSFAVFNLGMTPGRASFAAGSMPIAFILGAVPAGYLGARFGRRNVILSGLIGLTVALLAGFLLIDSPAVFVSVLVVCGFLWALVNVNGLPLVFDHGDERRIGAYTGLYYFSSQLAAVLGPTLSGILVQFLGSDYTWLWLFSTVFMGLAALAVLRVLPGRASENQLVVS
ncbi:MAG TPA: MFS transporter [Anaerolineales bacterium]|nr:MFS transporter [Anaerolineales bacterium]